MNVVREINRINERELELGTGSASWHDEYKDSAYIFVGGLHFDLTEGDVITIFSQYGEVMDVNLPRDKETGKTKGFAFLMYEDQRSTVLAVDNMNGANVLDRTLRVDHVKNYKQPKVKNEDGELEERDEQSLNAKPQMIIEDEVSSESSESSGPEIDPEDPMAAYLFEKRKEEKAKKKSKKSKSKKKHKDETPEERRARKEKRREKKALKASKKTAGLKGVEQLLQSWNAERPAKRPRSRSRSPRRERSGGPDQRSRDDQTQVREAPRRPTRSTTPTDLKERERRVRGFSHDHEQFDEVRGGRTRQTYRDSGRTDGERGFRRGRSSYSRSPPRRRD